MKEHTNAISIRVGDKTLAALRAIAMESGQSVAAVADAALVAGLEDTDARALSEQVRVGRKEAVKIKAHLLAAVRAALDDLEGDK